LTIEPSVELKTPMFKELIFEKPTKIFEPLGLNARAPMPDND
jgi:hypothetical protein